mmetsp:Transcript_52541/g.132786  ORF Transcript_52541/g.132786 Transcript_52541/m.132786 type:complete len:261 (-) Transcript_52541:169-951(-)
MKMPATNRTTPRPHVTRQRSLLVRRSKTARDDTKPIRSPKMWAKLSSHGMVPSTAWTTTKKSNQTKEAQGLEYTPQFNKMSPTEAPIRPKIAPEAPTESPRGANVAVAMAPKTPETTYSSPTRAKPWKRSKCQPTPMSANMLATQCTAPPWRKIPVTRRHDSPLSRTSSPETAPILCSTAAVGPKSGFVLKAAAQKLESLTLSLKWQPSVGGFAKSTPSAFSWYSAMSTTMHASTTIGVKIHQRLPITGPASLSPTLLLK